ncbi:MAG: outer membrane lipoprotein LolB [Rubrivivax sp.]|nr:outer membrane lipoprotein LolB [Rubrivivax sp.]
MARPVRWRDRAGTFVRTALLPTLLAGCATQPAPELPLTASGRMSVRVEAGTDRPAQSLTASFEWRGDGERGELALLTPLGTQLALARWRPGLVRLTTNEGEWRFDSLEALAQKAFGERLPLQAWPDWLAGRPWPGAPHLPLPAAVGARTGGAGTDSGGTNGEAARGGPAAAGFMQLGWRVDLAQQARGRIEARRTQPPAVTVRIVRDEAPGTTP